MLKIHTSVALCRLAPNFSANFTYCVCVKRKMLCNCLCCCYSSCFSASRVWDFRIVNQYSWFWKSLNMADRSCEFSFFARYSCKNWYKNWYLHFHKTYDQQIWRTDTSRGFDSNETNQDGFGDVITSVSRGIERCYNFHPTRTMILKFGQNNNEETSIKLRLTWMLTMGNSHRYSYTTFWSRGLTRWRDKLKYILPLLPQCLRPPNLVRWLIYYEELPLIQLYDPLTTWFYEVTQQINLHYHNAYTAHKMKFPIKNLVSCGFGHIYWRNP